MLFVDDVVLMGPSKADIEGVKKDLRSRLNVKDLGELTDFLGVLLKRDKNSINISQSFYTTKLLERFGMLGSNPMPTPSAITTPNLESQNEPVDNLYYYQELFGCLMYLSTRTRPDISFAVNILFRKFSKPFMADMTAAKRVLRYLCGTVRL